MAPRLPLQAYVDGIRSGDRVVLAMAIVVGLFLLTKGGDALSDHSSLLAKALGVPSVVVGLTIVSIATSAPELFTSIAAIRSNAQGLILGNIIGSNIANIGLILGLALMVKNVDTRDTISKNQITTLLLLTLVVVAFNRACNGEHLKTRAHCCEHRNNHPHLPI